tara:strand:+ start:260 stop:1105 length:846 start_codon:yes stop_codon:yes gene_type:complete
MNKRFKFIFLLSLFIILVYIVINIYKCKIEGYRSKYKLSPKLSKKDIVFSCTSYIALPNKFNELNNALSSFIKYNDLNIDNIDYYVINEYSEKNVDNLIEQLKLKYPFITFINKKSHQKGQAYSLNMVIDILKKDPIKYKYWLHWEESWFVTDPFMKDAYNIMNNNDIDQLQFTKDWQRKIPDNRKIYKENYYIIKKSHYEPVYKKNWKNWPLYSLRPGVDKVSKILQNGYFDTSEDKWPFIFEYDYAYKWCKLNTTKALLDKMPVKRSTMHTHTYTQITK